MKIKLSSNLALATGLIMGISAAAIQAFMKVQPPVADGICFLGHPSDLVLSLSNRILRTDFSVSKAFAVYPALTVVGVLAGSAIAASRNKDWKLQPGPVRKRFLAFIYGFLVVNFGLLWGACPIRTALLVSYGSVIAAIALASIIIGVILASIYSRLKAKKGVIQ